jgi:hypothetical protein
MKTFSFYCSECKADDERTFGLINYNPNGCGSEYLTDCDCGNLLTEVSIEASDEEIDRDKPACECKDCAESHLETPYSD